MSALPYHKRYHSDALAGMMPLTLEERGAYNTLLDLIYDRGGPLIDNERLLAGYMNCSIRKWRQLRADLIAKGKISVDRDGQITNSRARKEIENQSKTHRKLIEAGAKGGRTRAENEKKPNENSESGQASLEAGLSDPQATRARPEARSYRKREPIGSPKRQLPEDWMPSDFGPGTQSAAIVASWSRIEFERQLEAFRAHHRREGSKFADWQSAWSTWVLNSARFAERDRDRGPAPGRVNGGSSNPLVEQILAEEQRRKTAGASR